MPLKASETLAISNTRPTAVEKLKIVPTPAISEPSWYYVMTAPIKRPFDQRKQSSRYSRFADRGRRNDFQFLNAVGLVLLIASVSLAFNG